MQVPSIHRSTRSRGSPSCFRRHRADHPARGIDALAVDNTQSPALRYSLPRQIHRFNKAQQDFLLPYVSFLANYANGDARAALNLLENATRLYTAATITAEHLRETLQSKHLRYDKTGEEHYNTISAFIKSMRASDVDAALYYMARMVDSGEDPKFIARRMVIFASEDIGMADSAALAVANDVFRAVETIGLPECQFNLAHGVAYLATAKKNRAAGKAYFDALADVNEMGNLSIPLHIRNAPTRLMREIGYGDGYKAYTDESLLPEEIKGKRYYRCDS